MKLWSIDQNKARLRCCKLKNDELRVVRMFSGQKFYINIYTDNSSNGYGKCETVRDDRVESPSFTVLCHIHQFVLHRIRGESTHEICANEREIRARFAFFFLFFLFSLFSRRYFYRQSERVNGFSEYGSSVFAVTWCIKKKQRQYTMDKISIKSLPLVSNWRTTTSYRLIFKLGFKRGAVNNLHVASVWDFLFYKNQNNLARDM